MDPTAVLWIRNNLLTQPPVSIFKRMIIGRDYVTYEWEPPKKHQLSFINIEVPYIDEYRIDYKLPNNGGKWRHTICTGSNSITKATFHKTVYPHLESYLDTTTNEFHEHSFFYKDTDVFDIRIYGKNHADPNYNYLTHTSFSLHKNRRINKISGMISEVPLTDFLNKYYIISENLESGPWKNMKNYIATSFMGGWVFIYPDELEIIDGYQYIEDAWVDIKITDCGTTDTCSICLIPASTVSHCGHHFHRDCINQIIGNKCPMCRTNLNK